MANIDTIMTAYLPEIYCLYLLASFNQIFTDYTEGEILNKLVSYGINSMMICIIWIK